MNRWRHGRTWLEQREAERRSDERWHTAGVVSGIFVALILGWSAAAMAVGAW